ncbi:MAG: RtcB family protein, partial [Candidatus Electrothrix sp. AR5]|nr:RtcB family protein [Candidatus Electrothrix sp. AR5]
RRLMMQRMQDTFAEVVGEIAGEIQFEEMINIAHNYAAMENHFRKNVMIHRKGATKASVGQLGIIPGSQGTTSYIVQGKGEPESFMSCSHGAGRRMGRKQAQRELDLAAEKKRLNAIGVIHGIRNTKDLDEAPGAYKDISQVMENQKDLVDILVELRPLAVIKG